MNHDLSGAALQEFIEAGALRPGRVGQPGCGGEAQVSGVGGKTMRPKYLLVIWSVLVLAAQAWAADCGEWNTREFFEAVTVAEVQDCLAAGSEVNARTEFGRTPLHLAAVSNDNPAVTTALLAAGAEVNARDEIGITPLHEAAFNDNPAVITALLAAGADVDVNARRTTDGGTPLHFAVKYNDNPAVTTALLAAGAEVNARDGEGWTPLHRATWGVWGVDNPAVVVALLEAGADANARNNEGRTPWDYAQENEDFRGTDAYWRLNDARFR
ncbi:MAG: ankyrin repeat domain-containing protein [Truepera sp.]|nr:ankyrin repeat domain-containing protein [Truepera sp.]